MRIREFRKAKGLTQTELARKMGVTQTVVSDWEREEYLPRPQTLPELARCLGVTIQELYTNEAAAIPTAAGSA